MNNVLIVSDFSGSLDYYKRLADFKSHGFRVVGQVKTRSDLTEQLNKLKIDLFIVQEGFSGLEYDAIDDILRKNNEDAEIIVVSTNESPIRERKAMSKGAFAYLRRPLAAATFDIIIESVDKRIERNKKYAQKPRILWESIHRDVGLIKRVFKNSCNFNFALNPSLLLASKYLILTPSIS